MIRALGLSLILVCAGAACAPSPVTYSSGPLAGEWRVAVLPLANYSPHRDAPTRLMPVITAAFQSRLGYRVVDMGRVEDALAHEPWLLSDRIPPDLADSLGQRLSADALILGSVLDYGFRDVEGTEIPTISLSLRMIEVPGGELLWSAVHSRDGSDRESIFGFGRNENLSHLALETVREMLDQLPEPGRKAAPGARRPRTRSPLQGVDS